MSTRKSTIFYGVLVGFLCVVVGMVIASRLDLAPRSFAGPLSVPVTNSAPLGGAIDATTFRTIAHDASPAVVSILVTTTRPVADLPDLFGFRLPTDPQSPQGRQRGQTPREEQAMGAGSGFIIDKAGYILTNNHVIENAKNIEIHLSSMADDEPGLPAKVVGHDELTDTALLQLTAMPGEPLPEAKFGDSDQMAPGDWVMAIGNPFQLSNTVTVGVVSAVGRETSGAVASRRQEMIQTDAPINPGNSGGPLLNIRGEVIGINTMILSEGTMGGGSVGNIGVGFAVPINTVRDLLPQLRQGKVTRGRIGVGLERSITSEYARELGLPNGQGAEIKQVTSGGPAGAAGIHVGDVIVEFNGQTVKNNSALVRMVTSTAPGTTVPVKVIRDKKPVTVNVKVEELDLSQELAVANGPATRPRPQQNQSQGLGADVRDLTPRERQQLGLPAGRGGAVVTGVAPFSEAATAGLGENDVILSVDGQTIRTAEEAAKALNAIESGRTSRVVVWHDGEEQLLRLRRR